MYRLVEKIAIVALPLIACVPFAVVPFPPMLDFYTHIGAAHVIAFFQDPAFRYSEYYTLRLAQPMALVQLIIAGLERLMDPIVAGRVYLVGFTLASYGSTRFYIRSIGGEYAALYALAALPLANSGLVYLGFLPFIACWPLFALLLGVWGGGQSTLRRGAVTSVLIVVLFCCHPVGGAIAALALGCLTLGSIVRPPRRVLRLADALPLATSAAVFIPYLLVWGRFSGAGQPLSFAGPIQTLKAFLGYNLAASDRFSLYIKLGGLLALIVALVQSRRAWRQDLALTTIALLMFGLLIPVNVGSLLPAGPRFFPFALLVALGLFGLGPRGRLLFLAGVSVVVVLDVGCLTAKGLVLNRGYRAALSASTRSSLAARSCRSWSILTRVPPNTVSTKRSSAPTICTGVVPTPIPMPSPSSERAALYISKDIMNSVTDIYSTRAGTWTRLLMLGSHRSTIMCSFGVMLPLLRLLWPGK